jgi:hypothetical protein
MLSTGVANLFQFRTCVWMRLEGRQHGRWRQRTLRLRHADPAVPVDRCGKRCDADAEHGSGERTPKPSPALGPFEGSKLGGFDGERVMKLSRGLALACGLAAFAVGMAPPTAFADSPVHEMDEFSGEELLPAGTVCDFNYLQTFTLGINAIIFGDPADPSRSIEHASFTVTHTNLDTGYTLTEKGSARFTYRPRTRARRRSVCPGTCET